MPKYYLDSSGNPSNLPEDALASSDDLAEMQEQAIARAKAHPGTEYYVNVAKIEVVQVFRTVARLEMESEVIADPTQS